jgi:hypothetical protein
MSGKDQPAQVAAGEVIPASTVKILAMIAYFFAVLLGGLALAGLWWTGGELLPDLRISIYGGIAGLLAAAMSGVLLPISVVFLFAREKLIIADDRLQITHRSGGGQSVSVQIPFSNIANIALGDDEGVKFIGIDLHDPEAPDTFAPGCDFLANKASDGWHYRLSGEYQRSLDEIHEMILVRLRAREHA